MRMWRRGRNRVDKTTWMCDRGRTTNIDKVVEGYGEWMVVQRNHRWAAKEVRHSLGNSSKGT